MWCYAGCANPNAKTKQFHEYLEYGDWSQAATYVEATVIAVLEIGFEVAMHVAFKALLG